MLVAVVASLLVGCDDGGDGGGGGGGTSAEATPTLSVSSATQAQATVDNVKNSDDQIVGSPAGSFSNMPAASMTSGDGDRSGMLKTVIAKLSDGGRLVDTPLNSGNSVSNAVVSTTTESCDYSGSYTIGGTVESTSATLDITYINCKDSVCDSAMSGSIRGVVSGSGFGTSSANITSMTLTPTSSIAVGDLYIYKMGKLAYTFTSSTNYSVDMTNMIYKEGGEDYGMDGTITFIEDGNTNSQTWSNTKLYWEESNSTEYYLVFNTKSGQPLVETENTSTCTTTYLSGTFEINGSNNTNAEMNISNNNYTITLNSGEDYNGSL